MVLSRLTTGQSGFYESVSYGVDAVMEPKASKAVAGSSEFCHSSKHVELDSYQYSRLETDPDSKLKRSIPR